MSRDLPSPRGASGAAREDALALAMALLLVGLAAGTLLPRLAADGPGFPAASGAAVAPLHGHPPTAESAAGPAGPRMPSPPARLDLNASEAQALQTLPGVGPALAERIVAYRRAHGPFRTTQDLLQIPGIGPRRWERIRERVRVGEAA